MSSSMNAFDDAVNIPGNDRGETTRFLAVKKNDNQPVWTIDKPGGLTN